MVSEDWTLGEFGDERLTKRGVCFSRGWSLGRASAFGDWPVDGGAGLSGFRAFSPIRE